MGGLLVRSYRPVSSVLPQWPQIKHGSYLRQTLAPALAAQLAQKKSTLLKNRLRKDL
jgi:hypothetical protein